MNTEETPQATMQAFSAALILDALSDGHTSVVVHEDGATLIYSALAATVPQTAFAIRHGSGFMQVTVPIGRCDQLMITRATPMFGEARRSVFAQCVAVDAASGISTGISATDRTRTARLLAAPSTNASDLRRPGHVVPIAVDLPAALPPQVSGRDIALVAAVAAETATGNAAAVITELVADNGAIELPTPQQARSFASAYRLPVIDLRTLWDHLTVV